MYNKAKAVVVEQDEKKKEDLKECEFMDLGRVTEETQGNGFAGFDGGPGHVWP